MTPQRRERANTVVRLSLSRIISAFCHIGVTPPSRQSPLWSALTRASNPAPRRRARRCTISLTHAAVRTRHKKPPAPKDRSRRFLVKRYAMQQSGRRDSNPRHQAWKASALPTELLPRSPMLPAEATSGPAVVREGFEPSKACADRFTVCSRWPLEYLTEALSVAPWQARLPSFERADGRD